MKKLVPKMLALMILICSCSANKSFLHQRYTHFKHHKTTHVAENKSYVEKGTKTSATAPGIEVVKSEPTPKESAKAEIAKTEPLRYTKTVINRVVLPAVSKGKEKNAALVCNNSKLPVAEVTKIKPVKADLKHEKRGLLWGVIDGILAIILLAAFVLLVVWIVWLYTPEPHGW